MDKGKVSVTLKQGTRIAGQVYEAGDEVEVYDGPEKRWLIFNGYVEGDLRDAASPEEIAQGNMDRGAGVPIPDDSEAEDNVSPDAIEDEENRQSADEASEDEQNYR